MEQFRIIIMDEIGDVLEESDIMTRAELSKNLDKWVDRLDKLRGNHITIYEARDAN